MPSLGNFLRRTPANIHQAFFNPVRLTLLPKPLWAKRAAELRANIQKMVEISAVQIGNV